MIDGVSALLLSFIEDSLDPPTAPNNIAAGAFKALKWLLHKRVVLNL